MGRSLMLVKRIKEGKPKGEEEEDDETLERAREVLPIKLSSTRGPRASAMNRRPRTMKRQRVA